MVLTLNTSVRGCLPSFCALKFISFFCHTVIRSKFANSTCKERGAKSHLLDREVSKNVWVFVRTTAIINRYLGEILGDSGNILFLHEVSPLILSFISGSCLQWFITAMEKRNCEAK